MFVLLAKLLALAAFLGGPLFVADSLEGELARPWPFVIAIGPVVLLALGVFTLQDDPNDRVSRFLVDLGVAGAVVLLGENLYALIELSRGAIVKSRTLVAVGVVLGSGTALGYFWAAARFRRGLPLPGLDRPPSLGVSFRDVFLLLIFLPFVAAGVWMVLRGAPGGLGVLVLFSVFLAIAVWNLAERARFRSPSLKPAELRGGTTFRPSRTKTLLLLLAVLSVGLALFSFEARAPLLIQILAFGLIGLALLGFVLIFAGKLPVGSLRFDPSGMTIGQRSYRLVVPWDAIAAASAADVFGNPAALVLLRDPALAVASPPSSHGKALRDLNLSLDFYGAHLTILAGLYNLDVSEVAEAIARYAREPSARQELVGPRLE